LYWLLVFPDIVPPSIVNVALAFGSSLYSITALPLYALLPDICPPLSLNAPPAATNTPEVEMKVLLPWHLLPDICPPVMLTVPLLPTLTVPQY